MISLSSSTWLEVEAVLAAVGQAKIKPLMQAGLLVERRAKESMEGGRMRHGGRLKAVPSPPGTPPHVQTGVLRSSIKTAETSYGSVVVGPSSPPAWYGVVHEFGGRNHPPRPFMRPALAKTRRKFGPLWRRIALARTRAGAKLNAKKGRPRP